MARNRRRNGKAKQKATTKNDPSLKSEERPAHPSLTAVASRESQPSFQQLPLSQADWFARTAVPLKDTKIAFTSRAAAVIRQLNASLVGRDEAIRIALLAVVARQHCLLFGPPGTAKSSMCNRLLGSIRPPSSLHRKDWSFDMTLHHGSTLEDLVGPVDLAQLERSQYSRNLHGKICGSTTFFAFIDEIFKAERRLLSVLLEALNERTCRNGAVTLNLPLHTVFAASNELLPDAANQPLLDRFLLRVFVDTVHGTVDPATNQPVNMWVSSRNFLSGTKLNDIESIEFEDIIEVHRFATHHDMFSDPLSGDWASGSKYRANSAVPQVKQIVLQLDEFAENLCEPIDVDTKVEYVKGGSTLSDRRRTLLTDLLVFSAAACGRTSPHPFDVVILIYAMWKKVFQFEKVRDFVVQQLRSELNKMDQDDRIQEYQILDGHLFISNVLKHEIKSTEEAPDVSAQLQLQWIAKLKKLQRDEEMELAADRAKEIAAQCAAKEREAALRQVRRKQKDLLSEMKALADEEKELKQLQRDQERLEEQRSRTSTIKLEMEQQRRATIDEKAEERAAATRKASTTSELVQAIALEETTENVKLVSELVANGADVNATARGFNLMTIVGSVIADQKCEFLTSLVANARFVDYDALVGDCGCPLMFAPLFSWKGRKEHSEVSAFGVYSVLAYGLADANVPRRATPEQWQYDGYSLLGYAEMRGPGYLRNVCKALHGLPFALKKALLDANTKEVADRSKLVAEELNRFLDDKRE